MSEPCHPIDWRMRGFPILQSPGVCSNSCLLSQCCHPTISYSATLISFCSQYIPASGFFSNELALPIRWTKCWSFSCSISPSKEYLGIFSFRINGFDILSIQGTLKSLLQQHSSKALILWHSAFLWSSSHIHI